MKFFKKELCKQLDDLGCVSETQFAYYHNWPSPIYDIAIYPKPHEQIIICNAFSIYDFLSDEEYAYQNCFKLWGMKDIEHEVACDHGFESLTEQAFVFYRKQLSEAENQEAYIEEAVDRVIKENNNG